MVIGKDLRLRAMTEAEAVKLLEDREGLRLVNAMTKFILRRNAARN